MDLTKSQQLVVVQKKELAEIFGFETRNKYEIFDEHQQLIGFAAEQQKGLLGFLFRQLLGHWRTFEIHFFDSNRKEVLISKHPFKFFFQEFHVYNNSGQLLGYAKQRFGILTKKFDVYNERNELLFNMRSGLLSFWTFPIVSPQGIERAVIQKKWAGLLTEMFLDADKFLVSFKDAKLNQNEKSLVLALSVFTDLQYFESKGDSGGLWD